MRTMKATKNHKEVKMNKDESKEPTSVYWCSSCNTPVIRPRSEKEHCPLCKARMRFLANELRPVFPPEVKMLELLTGKDLSFKSVWKGRVSYYINGNSLKIANRLKIEADDKKLREGLMDKVFDKVFFDQEINRFIRANKEHLAYISLEAIEYIQQEAKGFDGKDIVVSFSGGKDSTVISDLVCRALPNQKVKHIFGDTTLEIGSTYKYVDRLKRKRQIELYTARNNDQCFFKMAKELGPPTMAGRWCCYMFKTGAINRVMNELFAGRALNFYGVRRNESVNRSNYNRTEERTESIKIANQRMCAPILYWSEIDVWLYILANKIDFNEAYTLGYTRVGCYTCPNVSNHSELMMRIYNHKEFGAWMEQIEEFGECVGARIPSEYAKLGMWKFRNGGNGATSAHTVKLKKTNCTTEENGRSYELYKDIVPGFYQLFAPFGRVVDGRKAISEKLILHPTSGEPFVSLQALGNRTIKIVTLNVQRPHNLHGRLAYQVVKWNACASCLKCESLCKHNAIEVKPCRYRIDDSKCTKCQACVNPKYIPGGCLMTRYLRTKEAA